MTTPPATPRSDATSSKPKVHRVAAAKATPHVQKHTGVSHAFRHVGRELQGFFTGHKTIED